jgi:thiol-disulfide isomerase/thioredoxin
MSRATPITVTALFLLAILAASASSLAEEDKSNAKTPVDQPPPIQQAEKDKTPDGEKPDQAKPDEKTAGDKSGQEKPEEKSAGDKTGQEKPGQEKPAAKPDPYVVPDGTPKELVQYIKKLLPTPVHSAAEMTKKRQALVQAAEKVLAGRPEEADLDFAVQIKLQLLELKKWTEFAEQLKKDGRGKQARWVRGIQMQVDLQNAARGGPLKLKKMLAEAAQFLQEEPPQQSDVLVAGLAGKLAEDTRDYQLTAETYRQSAKAFAVSKDEKLLEYSKLFEGIARRYDLPGNEIKVEGKLPDGQPFDWTRYKGKVVLVNFWASWDGTSVADLSKLQKLYDAYNAKGFDIVSVSCDHRAADLQKFLKEKKLSWAVVYGGDKPGPTPAYYGVQKVPLNILVGRDGKVITLEARGLKLKTELATLFGPLEEPKAPGADMQH